jgi:hypothetical protein
MLEVALRGLSLATSRGGPGRQQARGERIVPAASVASLTEPLQIGDVRPDQLPRIAW